MLDRIIHWSIAHRLLVVLGAAALLLAGTYTAWRMPVDVFPDLTAPTATGRTEAHGMAPEEVETLVTFPVETAVNGASGVRRIRSSTSQGISIVWVEFDWGTDLFQARQIVTEKLQLVTRSPPEGVPPPVLAPISSIMGEIMLIGITGAEGGSPMEVRSVADWTLRRRLLAVPGVSQVVPIGGEVKQYQVRVSPERLRAYGITLRTCCMPPKRPTSTPRSGSSSSSGAGGRPSFRCSRSPSRWWWRSSRCAGWASRSTP